MSPTYFLLTGIVLITMFTVLVAAHELGHYLFARLFNMGVEEFAIGFGKPEVKTWLKRVYRVRLGDGEIPDIVHTGVGPNGELPSSRIPDDIKQIETPEGTFLEETTRFTIRPWPIGGFVRIKGMVPEEDGSETKIAGGFYSKPPWQRFIVLLAGPAFSVIAGLAILIPVLMVEGMAKPLNVPKIGAVVKDGPADKAGLKEGDVVESIDGHPINTFYAMNVIVRDSAGKTLMFNIRRGSKELTLAVKPELEANESALFDKDLNITNEKRRQAKLKTSIPSTRIPIGLFKATSVACSIPVDAVESLLGIFRHPSTFKDSVSGPITITSVTYDTVKYGIGSILELTALLSISVGVFNLLPIVPLDGGQMMIALAEMLRGGRRLSMKVQSAFNRVGLMMMGALIICVLFIDIGRLRGGSNVVRPPEAKKASK